MGKKQGFDPRIISFQRLKEKGLEHFAAALEILEQVHLQPAAEVIVLGDGKLGQLCAQVLHLTGAREP
jgi:threonine dehydrogenase-like Zn-dependent dehydrogenase